MALQFLLLLLAFVPPLLHAQQSYEGILTTDCGNQHESSSLLGYFCNSQPFCQAYLTFHSQPPYDSAATISSLLGADPSQIAQANSVQSSSTFTANTKLLVPVNCSCSGRYYQFNSSYTVISDDNYLIIANNTYQGLSTCQAIINQSATGTSTLIAGEQITVPLRCACPTNNQTSSGVKYLLSYLIDSGDTLFSISTRLGVDQEIIQVANELTGTNIYPFTTLLVPLHTEPTISQLAAPTPPPQSPPPPPPTTSSSHSHTGLYAGIGAAAGALLVIAVLVVLYFVRRAKSERVAGKTIPPSDSEALFGKSSGVISSNSDLSKDVLSKISEIGHALRVYKFEELQMATENFSYECLVQGSVYRGMFNSDAAAVEVVNRDVSREIEILKKISHFNLIKLSGVCFHQGQWFLVYEYAENGSLSSWLFDRSGTKVLSWIQRVQIALDVAHGLSYLHRYTEPAHVHKDVRSSNILLDQMKRAKIANFAMARAAHGDDGEFVLTRHIVGAKGHLAPEYLEHGLVSPKMDVYAFGVVMMEIVTGRDASVAQRGSGEQYLAWGDQLVAVLDGGGEGAAAMEMVGGFVDPLLEGNYPADLVLQLIRLIERCVKRDADSRPNMEEVAQALSGIHAMSSSPGGLAGERQSSSDFLNAPVNIDQN